MSQHIKFIGDSIACGRLLPFAKRKMLHLKNRVYRGKSHWSRQYVVDSGGVIALERDGPIDHIRITAGVTGYEYQVALSGVGNYFSILSGVRFCLAKRYSDSDNPGERVLRARNHNGRVIKLANDGFDDAQDNWVATGFWQELYQAAQESGSLLGNPWIAPFNDWFQMPVLSDAPEDAFASAQLAAEWRANGYSANVNIITSCRWHPRYFDRNTRLVDDFSFNSLFKIDYLANPSLHKVGKKSKQIVMPMLHVDPPDDYLQDPDASYCGSAAIHPAGYYIGGSISAEDYKFALRDINNEELYYEVNASSARPAWVDTISYSKWYWRSDGQRCMAVLYEVPDPHPDPPVNIATRVPKIIKGIVELQINIVRGPTDAVPPALTVETIFAKQYHEGIWPIAVDYDLFDQRIRRVIYQDAYIGPAFIDVAVPMVRSEYYVRPLLCYLHFATLDDAGNISAPEFSIPMSHVQMVSGKPTTQNYAGTPAYTGTKVYDFQDENGYWINDYWRKESNPMELGSMGLYGYLDVSGVEFPETFGYSQFNSAATCLDARAQAVLVHYAFSQYDPPADPDGTVYIIPFEGYRWRIWGEQEFRQHKAFWSFGGNELNPAEMAAGPDAFIGALVTPSGVATPPIGYVKFEPGHALWTDAIIDLPVMRNFKNKTDHLVDFSRPRNWLSSGAEDEMLQLEKEFTGFHISPKKHFSLYFNHAAPDWQEWGATYELNRVQVYRNLNVDYIEWFALDEDGNPDPTVSSHLELYNEARGVTLVEGDDGTGYFTEADSPAYRSMCLNALWVV